MARLHACKPMGQQGRQVNPVRHMDGGPAVRWHRPGSKRNYNRERKLPPAELMEMLDLGGIEHRAIRRLGAYSPRTRDLRKQLADLVEHLFAVYSVPRFLIPCCFREEGAFDHARATYRQWLVTIAQGGSFPKLAQPYMTSRESHLFLSAPARQSIHENVWWAKLTAAGLPHDKALELIRRIFTNHFFDDPHG